MKRPAFKPGDRVKLTGKFLRNTGQFTGDEGRRVWTVQECPCDACARGERVRTDQQVSPLTLEFWTADELAAHPYLRDRHIATANLYKLGTLTSENSP